MKTSYYISLFIFTFLPLLINAQTEKSEELKFIDLYYENSNHERMKGLKKKDRIIYLIIETKNGIGKEVSIEMNEEDPDVIYKNRYITVGDSFNYIIKKDRDRLKFRVFNLKNKKHLRLKRKRNGTEKNTI